MKLNAFSLRNLKEIARDPLNMAFGLGFPVAIMLLLTAIQANIPNEMFVIEELAPGLCIFGLSFVALFSATLISKDRSSSLLLRLLASPLTASDFILGYTLPLLPLAVAQSVFTLAVGACMGMHLGVSTLVAVAVLIPAAVLNIALGLLCGTIFNDKQVGGICGALLTNLTAWLSGIWFSIDLVGGVFKAIADALPFVHAVNAVKAAQAGNYAAIFPELWWVIGYAAVMLAIAVAVFSRKMKVA